MGDFPYGLLLSLLAGLSSWIGFLAVLRKPKDPGRLTARALGFAGGAMLAVSVYGLIPEAASLLSGAYRTAGGTAVLTVCLLCGFLTAMGLDRTVPQKGGAVRDRPLYRIGIVSCLALALHNFPEGMATMLAGIRGRELGLTVAVGIALHNIPEGLSIALPVYYGTGSKAKSLFYVSAAALAEPLGAVLAYLVFGRMLTDAFLGIAFALIAGIMLYITFEELLPASRAYGTGNGALFSVLAGVVMIVISHAL